MASLEILPHSFGIALTAIVLWHVLKAEKAIEKMAERPAREDAGREPDGGGVAALGAEPDPDRD